MADELKTEEEQMEELRAWWKENQTSVLAGIAVVVIALFGWNYKVGSDRAALEEASAIYNELTDEIVDADLDAAEALAMTLASDYADSPYHVQSRLAMARLYMDSNRDEDAANALRSVLEIDGYDALKQIARLRLAKILMYQDKAEEALDAVSTGGDEGFAARFAEARGDAYVALEDFENARNAYTTALADENANRTIDQRLVQLKLYDLPASVADSSGDDSEEASESDVVESANDEEGGA